MEKPEELEPLLAAVITATAFLAALIEARLATRRRRTEILAEYGRLLREVRSLWKISETVYERWRSERKMPPGTEGFQGLIREAGMPPGLREVKDHHIVHYKLPDGTVGAPAAMWDFASAIYPRLTSGQTAEKASVIGPPTDFEEFNAARSSLGKFFDDCSRELGALHVVTDENYQNTRPLIVFLSWLDITHRQQKAARSALDDVHRGKWNMFASAWHMETGWRRRGHPSAYSPATPARFRAEAPILKWLLTVVGSIAGAVWFAWCVRSRSVMAVMPLIAGILLSRLHDGAWNALVQARSQIPDEGTSSATGHPRTGSREGNEQRSATG
jgi:hypothetical protein